MSRVQASSIDVYRRLTLYAYDGVRRVSGFRRDPAVSVEDLTHIYISNREIDWKIDYDSNSCKNSMRATYYFKLRV